MGETRRTTRFHIRLAVALAALALVVLLLRSAFVAPAPLETLPGRDPSPDRPSTHREITPPDPALRLGRETSRDDSEDPLEDPPIDRLRTSEDDSLEDAPFDGPATGAASASGGRAINTFSKRGRRLLPEPSGPRKTQRPMGAVDLALQWLADHQDEAGFWDPATLRNRESGVQIDGEGSRAHRVGVTAVALLAFTGAGETHKAGNHRKTVKAGLRYLKKVQDPEGRYGPTDAEDSLLGHAWATHAMAETYALTGSPLFRASLGMAAKHLIDSRTDDGGWPRAEDSRATDSAVTVWALLALHAARSADPKCVPDGVPGDALAWLDGVTHGPTGLVLSTRHPDYHLDRDLWITAGAAFARTLHTRSIDSDAVRMAAEQCLRRLPVWQEGRIDVPLWHLATHALFQRGGSTWQPWNTAMKKAVIDSQRKDGDARGSWDPIGPWTDRGGRVWSTAMLAMCLEVYYRYGRVKSR